MNAGRAPTEDELKHRAAQLRSMSPTRMLDYGMDHWDAAHLTSSPASQPWDETAEKLADAQLEIADAAAAAGHVATAVASYLRATAALVFAQMADNRDTPRKRALYARMSHTYQQAANLNPTLDVRKLSVPFGGSHCNAWLVSPRSSQPTAAVVIVGGQSGWGPAYHRQAEALAARGLTAVLLEGPGQGEARLAHGLHLGADVAGAFTATLDAVQAETGQEGPFGVWGNSFGGLLAARAALHDARFTACCVNGAPARPEPAPFRTAIEQSEAMLGVSSDTQVGEVFRALWVDPSVDQTAAEILVLHGGQDPLITLDQQRPFLNLSPRSRLRVWDDGEHTIYNHSAERTDYVTDWFHDRLGPS